MTFPEPAELEAFITGMMSGNWREANEAFRGLFLSSTPYLKAVVRNTVRLKDTSTFEDDVTQHVFMKLWKCRREILEQVSPQRFKSYLAKMCVHRATDELRRFGKLRKEVVLEPQSMAEPAKEDTDIVEIIDTVDSLLGRLSEEEQVLLKMYMRSEKIKDISDKTGVKYATVRTKIHRALTKLRNILGET